MGDISCYRRIIDHPGNYGPWISFHDIVEHKPNCWCRPRNEARGTPRLNEPNCWEALTYIRKSLGTDMDSVTKPRPRIDFFRSLNGDEVLTDVCRVENGHERLQDMRNL